MYFDITVMKPSRERIFVLHQVGVQMYEILLYCLLTLFKLGYISIKLRSSINNLKHNGGETLVSIIHNAIS